MHKISTHILSILLLLFTTTTFAQEAIEWQSNDGIMNSGSGIVKTGESDGWNDNLATSGDFQTSSTPCFSFDLSSLEWEGEMPFKIAIHDQDINSIDEAPYVVYLWNENVLVEATNFSQSLVGSDELQIQVVYGVVKVFLDGIEIYAFSSTTTASDIKVSFSIYTGGQFLGAQLMSCTATAPSTQSCQTISSHKYVESKAYAPDSREISNAIQMRNNLGQNLQSQTRNYDKNQVLASQVIYDRQGRAAMETFSAPISGTDFCYDPNFITAAGSVNPYSYLDFDGPETTSNTSGEEFNPKEVALSSTLGDYYSGTANPNYSNTLYPYVRKHYSDDLLQEPERITGYSEVYKAGNGKEKLMLNTVSGTELEYLYGVLGSWMELSTEENFNLKLFKTIVRDENENTSILYSNADGQTIAAASSGNGGNCISQVGSLRMKQFVQNLIHVPASKTDKLRIRFPDPRGAYDNFSPSAVYPINAFDITLYDKLNRKTMVEGTDYSITLDASANDARMHKINLLGSYANVENVIGVSFQLTSVAQTTWWEFLQYSWVNFDPELFYELDYDNWQLNYFDAKGNLVKKVQPEGVNCNYDASGSYSYANHSDVIAVNQPTNSVIYSAEVVHIANNSESLNLAIFPSYIMEYEPDHAIGNAYNGYLSGHTSQAIPEGENEYPEPAGGEKVDMVTTANSDFSQFGNAYGLNPLGNASIYNTDGSIYGGGGTGDYDKYPEQKEYWKTYKMEHRFDINIYGLDASGTEIYFFSMPARMEDYTTYSWDSDGNGGYDDASQIKQTKRFMYVTFGQTEVLVKGKDAFKFDKLSITDQTTPSTADLKKLEIRIANVQRREKPYLTGAHYFFTSSFPEPPLVNIPKFNIVGTFGHKMISTPSDIVHNSKVETFEYNNFNRMISQTAPDEGTSEYVYATNGSLKFSQNPVQKLKDRFSYTLYDKAFRPVETGEYYNPGPGDPTDPNATYVQMNFTKTVTGTPPSNNVHSLKDAADGLNDANCISVTTFLYDVKATDIPSSLSSTFSQHYLSGRLSKSSNSVSTTWYSYDNYGNIEWTIQDIYELGVKTIRYQYDNVGKLIATNYNEGQSDDFYIKYSYNSNDALIAVLASDHPTQGFKKMASYQYDVLGNLIRKELGNNYQGLDLAYTAKGQLKSINNAYLSAEDLGKDGLDHSNTFIADLFAETLSYHEKDFVGSGSHFQTASNSAVADDYTGLIKSTTWYENTQTTLPNALGSRPTYNYSYDHLGQLTQAVYGTSTAGSLNGNGTGGSAPVFTANVEQQYKVTVAYDLNGNITTLNRNSWGANLNMDVLTYNYNANKNSLSHISDGTLSASAGDMYNQAANNYGYDALGRLTSDVQGDMALVYNPQGLVSTVTNQAGTTTRETTDYNEGGLAIRKVVYSAGSAQKVIYRVFDASSKLLAEYEKPINTGVISLKKTFVNGIERAATAIYSNDAISDYHYEIKDHIGNVRTVFRNNPVSELHTDFSQGSLDGWTLKPNTTTSFVTEGIKISSDKAGGLVKVFNNLQAGGRYTVSVGLSNINANAVKVSVKDLTNGSATMVSSIIGEGYNELTFNNVNTNSMAIHVFIPNSQKADSSNYIIEEVTLTKDDLEVLSYADYYPFGWEMPGRKYTSSATDNEYGYSGDYSRKNDQFNWNEFQFRNYDSRLGRWLSPDPARQYHSPFVGMGNNPISVFDPTGLWGYSDGNGHYLYVQGFQAHKFVDASGRVWTKVAESLSDMVDHTGGINRFAQAKLTGTAGSNPQWEQSIGKDIGLKIFRNPSGHLSDNFVNDLSNLSEVYYRNKTQRFILGVRDNIPIVSSFVKSGQFLDKGEYGNSAIYLTLGTLEWLSFGVVSTEVQATKVAAKEVTEEVVEEVAEETVKAAFKYNRHGQLTNGVYTVSKEAMKKHVVGGVQGRSVFYPTLNADEAVLRAAQYADEAGLWIGNKAKVQVTNTNIGTLGNGTPTNVINVYRNAKGSIHGSPGTVR